MKTKSKVLKKLAKKRGLKFVNLKMKKCDPVDLRGLPFDHPRFAVPEFEPDLELWLKWAQKK